MSHACETCHIDRILFKLCSLELVKLFEFTCMHTKDTTLTVTYIIGQPESRSNA